MCTNTSCCCQRCFTVWIRSNYARVQIFGPLLRGPDGASIIYDVPVVNVTSQKTYFKLGTLYSLNWKQGVTMTTWSVMSCCCDAPLNNPVTIICRWGIRFLTPGPKRHIRGVIIQWKLTGWYHSTSTALWGKHESIQYLLTETWYHSQLRAVTVQYMSCTGWWETLNVKWVTPSHTLLLLPCYFFLNKLEQQLIYWQGYYGDKI